MWIPSRIILRIAVTTGLMNLDCSRVTKKIRKVRVNQYRISWIGRIGYSDCYIVGNRQIVIDEVRSGFGTDFAINDFDLS